MPTVRPTPSAVRAIQRFIPEPRHVELHRITVAAPPALAWQAARHVDGADIPWVRLLFSLRTIPSRLAGAAAPEDARLSIDQIAEDGSAFAILEERDGCEVVVGAIGKFWHLDIPFLRVAPEGFAAFAQPGWGKVAWSIRVEPFEAGSVVTLELRVTATDEESWRRQERYFLLIGKPSHMIRSSMMAHLEAELGALHRPDDKARELPGDEYLTPARYALTHGIDIEAPPELVWPWLMQLGCDRGGWYSIDALDNGGAPSVEHLEPAWRTRAVRDKVATTPKQDGHYDVLRVEPDRLFVMGAETDRLGGHVAVTWAFVLEPLGADATHLVTRVRARGVPRWSEWLQGAVIFPPIHAVMQHAQLATLKRLAEREAQARRIG